MNVTQQQKLHFYYRPELKIIIDDLLKINYSCNNKIIMIKKNFNL